MTTERERQEGERRAAEADIARVLEAEGEAAAATRDYNRLASEINTLTRKLQVLRQRRDKALLRHRDVVAQVNRKRGLP